MSGLCIKTIGRIRVEKLVERAIREDVVLKQFDIKLKETNALFLYSSGDARKLLNILELLVNALSVDNEVVITDEVVEKQLQKPSFSYDKKGEMHYDIVSAFIKSIREFT